MGLPLQTGVDTRLDDQHHVPPQRADYHERRPQLEHAGIVQRRPVQIRRVATRGGCHSQDERAGRGGEHSEDEEHHIRFGQECRGIVAAQPQAKPERTQRDAARRNEPQGQQVYLAVVAGCASLPARQELSDKPLQPDAHQEPHLFGAGYLQRAYCEPHLPAVQLQIHLRLQQERPLNLRFLGPGRGIFLGHHSRVSRMEQLSVTAAAADRDI